MEDIIDLIATDASASEVSDKIKDLLYAKSGEKVDAFRPHVANSLFGDQETEIDDEEQYETEAELEVEEPEEEAEE